MPIQLNRELIDKLKSLGIDYVLTDSALKKMKEDDRRFLMSLIQQDINFIAHFKQFRMIVYLSYFAIFISIYALFSSINAKIIYYYIVGLIFLIGTYWILYKRNQSEKLLYSNLIETYNHIRSIHFDYLKGKIKIE